MAQARTAEKWGTRIGVILAVAGSAVGLGNFLRFPGNAAENGGGAFMVPYFISLLILGIPLCWAEWTMGRYAGIRGCNSAPSIFTAIWPNRMAKYFGAPALMIPLVIYMYYVLIEAWCLGYAINYLTGSLMKGSDSEAYASFFSSYVGDQGNGELLKRENLPWMLVLVGTFGLNFFLIYRGVTKGIETFCRYAMPCMIVLAVIVLIRVMTLAPHSEHPDQNVVNGLGFMWNPKWEKLQDPQTWLAASGQIFFSLSVGFGIIINYASYLRKDDDVVLSGLTASSMNEFFEVCLGGLITLPAAFIFLGLAAAESTGSSFALGFIALPNVFAQMPGGQFFGFLWFFMLFIAAITSSVSMLQPVIAFLEEGFGLKRHASATVLGLLAALGCGFVMYFSKGLVALDTFDFWIGSVLIFILALIQAILYGWIFGIDRGEEEAHRGAHLRIPRFVQYVLKYVVPVYLLAIFAMFCYDKIPSKSEKLFDTDAAAATALDAEAVSPALAQEFATHESNLPEGAQVTGEGKRWSIRDADGALLFRLTMTDDRIDVLKHKPGYAEAILNNPGALGSVIFITVLFMFMLVMIHIAGRRWEAEGKFAPEATP